jgi:hypothetical protein
LLLNLSEIAIGIQSTSNQSHACTAIDHVCRIEMDDREMDINRVQQGTTEIPAQKRSQQPTDGRRGSKGGKDTALHLFGCGTQYQRANQASVRLSAMLMSTMPSKAMSG